MTSITNSAHVATLLNGTYSGTDYTTGIGSTTLKTFCNDNAGYAIYAIGYTNDTYGNTKLHWNKASSLSDDTNDIETALYTQGTTINSTWSMKLASSGGTYATTIVNGTNNEENFTSWHEVPDEYTKVAYRTSGTDMEVNGSGEGSSITVTYDSYISAGQPAGAYMGKVKYTLVYPNDASMPIDIETAYALAGKQKYNGYYKIQDMNPIICSGVNQYNGDSMASVIDVRDNRIYKIAKLIDNNCWMLENLALDPTDPTTAANMSTSNTNASAEAIANLLNGGSSTTGESSVAVADLDTNFNSYTEPRINNASKDTLVGGYGLASNNGQSKVGIYYNFCAATVGTYCYDENYALDGTAYQDICPTGWRMPLSMKISQSTSDYYVLGTLLDISYYVPDGVFYGDKVIDYLTTLSINLSGVYYNNSAHDQNEKGYWWSSEADYGDGVILRSDYDSEYSDYSVFPLLYSERSNGHTIRCIAESQEE